jgi:hypothetical protein
MLWTLATHYPYKSPAFPDVRAAEIVAGDQAAEFARRQRIAADDLAWFERQLAADFPGESFLVVGFGDHQPKITESYFSRGAGSPLRPVDAAETRFLTYFRVDGVNFEPRYDALSPKASIGYLGEMILGRPGCLPHARPWPGVGCGCIAAGCGSIARIRRRSWPRTRSCPQATRRSFDPTD